MSGADDSGFSLEPDAAPPARAVEKSPEPVPIAGMPLRPRAWVSDGPCFGSAFGRALVIDVDALLEEVKRGL